MSCFDLLAVVALGGLAGVGAAAFGRRHGWISGLIGAIVVPSVIGVVVVALLVGIEQVVDRIRPPWPFCRRGRCRYRGDYVWNAVADELLFGVCRCGDRYAAGGGQFFIVSEQGSRIPFRVLGRGWRRWEPDPAAPAEAR